MKRLLISFLLCVPAVANPPLPIRCTVNMTCSGDPANPECLHPSHIGKGWPDTIVTDAACRADIDPGGCWIKVNRLANQSLGRYFSWRLVDKCDAQFPIACISQTQAKLTNREIITYGGRTYANVMDLEVRQKYIEAARLELDHHYTPIVLHDNITHRTAEPNWPITWEATCRYLAGLREEGRVLLPNVAGPSVWWPWADLELFAESADGVAREIGVHPKIRADPAQLTRQIAADRYLLERGKWVVLMWANGVLTKELADMNATAEQKAAAWLKESEYTAAYCLLIRKPGEHCYVHWSFWQAHPSWVTWADKLGEPLGDYTMGADGSMERYFKGGALKVKPPRSVEVVEVQ